MNQTFNEIDKMEESLLGHFTTLEGTKGLEKSNPIEIISAYSESIRWKLKFLEHHYQFLTNIQWKKLYGKVTSGNRSEFCVSCGNCKDVIITVSSLDGAKMMVFNSVDGLVAACVNAADTLSKMLNILYRLRIEDLRVNCPLLLQTITPDSPLAVVFGNYPGIKWMSPLRKLRGECQHCNLASVIEEPHGSFGIPPSDLLIKEEYVLDEMLSRTIRALASTIKSKTLDLFQNAAQVIAKHPSNACILKT
jgi:hypothetical protein